MTFLYDPHRHFSSIFTKILKFIDANFCLTVAKKKTEQIVLMIFAKVMTLTIENPCPFESSAKDLSYATLLVILALSV